MVDSKYKIMNRKISHDSETPAHGQQVISACAFIHDDFNGVKKVFLAKRASTKKFLPSVFELPGGHTDFGEEIVAGLKREIQEEFEMSASIGDPFFVYTYKNEIKGSHTVQVIYFAQFTNPLENIRIHPEDHSSYEWFTYEEVIARKNEIRPEINVPHEYEDDPEYLAILRGFKLLEVSGLNFG
jgi:8-oxo-dGTP pyrophosphatase MutT (NUDIX family)